MRTTVAAVAIGVVCFVGCLPTKDRLVTCTQNSDCSEGFVCDRATKYCVCDGTATFPGCASFMDAHPSGPEVMTPGDTVQATDRGPSSDGTQIDTATPDAASPPDTAVPDSRPVECTSSAQCPVNAPICSSSKTCVACTAASQCLAKDASTPVCATTGAAAGQCVQCADDSACQALPGTPVCDAASNRCVECRDSTSCSGAAPICDVASGRCTACTAASQCLAKDAGNPACVSTGAAAGQCVQCTDDASCRTVAATPACNTAKNKCVECTGHGHCLPAAPLCDVLANKCLKCLSSSDCGALADPRRAVCAPAGACVQCSKNADCSGDTPLCDTSANKCVPCTASSQCAALADGKRAVCNPSSGACVECIDNTTCGGNTPICDSASNKCVPCTASSQCAALADGERAVCNRSSGACVECTASTSCAGTTPICSTTTNKCSACSASSECASLGDVSRAYCGGSGACVACTNSSHCSGTAGTPHCETGSNKCVECLVSSNCSGTKPICSGNLCGACKSDDECAARDSASKACATAGTSAGACVACTSNSHCGGSTPICNTATNECRACTGDSECTGMGPGVCMKHQDGRCATDAETVVVTSSATLPATFPTGKRLVIIRGSVTGTAAWALPSNQLTIIGQNTGLLTGNGSAATMHLTGGDFYMRDLSITGGAPGLWVDGGAIARLDHVSVSNNTKGGILLDGAAFDIKDTTVNSNGPNTAGYVFGGITLQNTPAAGPKTLSRSTINNNQLVGVSCGVGSAVSPVPTDVLATGNVGGQIGDSCAFTSCAAASSTCGAQP